TFDQLVPCDFEEQEKEYQDLSSFDVVMNRKEPPVNEEYLLQCQLLMFHPTVLNSPLALQAYNEKLLPLYFHVGIPTSVGLEVAPRDGIIKPLNLFGGKGVEKIAKDTPMKGGMFQNFLPDITQGEVRYLTVGEEVFGEVLKIPK